MDYLPAISTRIFIMHWNKMKPATAWKQGNKSKNIFDLLDNTWMLCVLTDITQCDTDDDGGDHIDS